MSTDNTTPEQAVGLLMVKLAPMDLKLVVVLTREIARLRAALVEARRDIEMAADDQSWICTNWVRDRITEVLGDQHGQS